MFDKKLNTDKYSSLVAKSLLWYISIILCNYATGN